MTKLEKSELVVLVLLTVSVYLLAPALPFSVDMANAVLWFAALIFAQSLLRDVTILVLRKRSENTLQSDSCMCVESVFGASVLLLGFALFAVGVNADLTMSPSVWSLIFAVVVAINFLLKDWVIAWRPFALRREKDHLNIVVKW